MATIARLPLGCLEFWAPEQPAARSPSPMSGVRQSKRMHGTVALGTDVEKTLSAERIPCISVG
jgi:hypothetical protein